MSRLRTKQRKSAQRRRAYYKGLEMGRGIEWTPIPDSAYAAIVDQFRDLEAKFQKQNNESLTAANAKLHQTYRENKPVKLERPKPQD